MKFTSHNILLNDGIKTLNDEQFLLSESALWKSIESSLDLFIRGTQEERRKLRVVDLGCLEGGYSVEFAKLGFDTLGIDARQDNIDKCNYVKAKLDLPNLNFVTDDVRNLSNYGKFDIVLCYGLLYHLDDPINFLKKVNKCTNKLLLLHTHYAQEHDIRYDSNSSFIFSRLKKRLKLFDHSMNYDLSALTTNEGYKGRWFKEWEENTSKSKIEKLLWASYNNSKAFWLCKKDLTKALRDIGFNNVFEQFDYTGDILKDNYTEYYDRTMFVALNP